MVRRAKSSVSSACAATLRNRYNPTLLSFRNVMRSSGCGDFGFGVRQLVAGFGCLGFLLDRRRAPLKLLKAASIAALQSFASLPDRGSVRYNPAL